MLHLRQPRRDLARDELAPAQGRFVIEQDAATSMQAVAFAIVDGDPVRKELGYRVGAARMKRRTLGLRAPARLAVHFRGRSLIEADRRVDGSDRFQNARGSDRVNIGGVDRLLERGSHKTLRREVVNLVRPGALDHPQDIGNLGDVEIDQFDVAQDTELGEPPGVV